jgi:hypothetical protein
VQRLTLSESSRIKPFLDLFPADKRLVDVASYLAYNSLSTKDLSDFGDISTCPETFFSNPIVSIVGFRTRWALMDRHRAIRLNRFLQLSLSSPGNESSY